MDVNSFFLKFSLTVYLVVLTIGFVFLTLILFFLILIEIELHHFQPSSIPFHVPSSKPISSFHTHVDSIFYYKLFNAHICESDLLFVCI